MRIYGAGLAGLLAGCVFQNAEIFEAGEENQSTHKALLRFRSSDVGDLVGVDFKRVRVHKGIFTSKGFVQPDIENANNYSKKVIGKLSDRSIWNIEASDRFIAPEDFILQLTDRCRNRIHWNHPVDKKMLFDKGNSISTMPMGVTAKILGVEAPRFENQSIVVKRWRVKNADCYQTIYYPDPYLHLYRASITGDLLIAEYTGMEGNPDETYYTRELIFRSFGISEDDIEEIETVNQRYGKIAKIDEGWRKSFIHSLSVNNRIFSLGRFGTWRNILLDDVVNDITVIKKLISASSYDIGRANAD